MISETLSPRPRRWWPLVLVALIGLLWTSDGLEMPSSSTPSSIVEEITADKRPSSKPSRSTPLRTAGSLASLPPGGPLSFGQPHDISLLTLNLETGGVRGRNIEARTNAVARLIRRLRPDAVALQEVAQSNSNYRNRGKVLADKTGYHLRWRAIDSIPFYSEGVALLSRWPIASTFSTSLPHRDMQGAVKRAALGARIEHPQTPFSFFVTHLNVDPSPTVQRDQTHALWSFVDEHRTARPSFLAGDLNMTPDQTGMKFLRGDRAISGDRPGFVDAWQATNADAPGSTVPADAPKRRIDYIFNASANERTTAASCRRVLTEPVEGVRASDHFGVLCSFEVGPAMTEGLVSSLNRSEKSDFQGRSE